MAFAGCTAKSEGSVKIVSISPEPYSVMRVGDTVTLKVEVEYTAKSAGDISLVVQKEDKSSLGSATEAIKAGSGRVTLQQAFIVPETRTVTVFTPLNPAGTSKTMIVDSRTFNIAPKK